jgi:hypothetical protein
MTWPMPTLKEKGSWPGSLVLRGGNRVKGGFQSHIFVLFSSVHSKYKAIVYRQKHERHGTRADQTLMMGEQKKGRAHLQNFLPSASEPVQWTVILAPLLGVGPLPSFSTWCKRGKRRVEGGG